MSLVVTAASNISITPEILVLALHTLSCFEFSEGNLSEFLRRNILQYLSHSSTDVRKEAIYAISHIVLSDSLYVANIGIGSETISEVVQGLVAAAVADPDLPVRMAAIDVLVSNTCFDFQMGKVQNIQGLFLLLNDEAFELRLRSLELAGRLAQKNPAYMLPSLRRMVVQLLAELEYARGDKFCGELIQLLLALIQAAEYWARPFVRDVLYSIMPHINDSSPVLTSKLFDIVAALAQVGGSDLAPHFDMLLASITQALGDQSSAPKRMSALNALNNCITYSGLEIDPHTKYQPLLEALAKMIKNEPEDKAVEVMRAIGTLGAVDRRRYNIVISTLASAVTSAPVVLDDSLKPLESSQKDARLSKKTRRHGGPAPNVLTLFNGDKPLQDIVGGIHVRMYGLSFVQADYYIDVSVNALLQILEDPVDPLSHQMAVQALDEMFTSLKGACIKHLHRVMSAVLNAMDLSPPTQPEVFVSLLQHMVGIVGCLATPYVPKLLELIGSEAPTSEARQLALTGLIEVVSEALSGDFGAKISDMLSFLLGVIEKDESDTRKPTISALHALRILSPSLDSYLFLVMPRLVSLLDPTSMSTNVVESTLECISSIFVAINCNSFASRVIHRLVQLLQCSAAEPLHTAVVDVLCTLMEHLQSDFVLFMPTISATMEKCNIGHHERYSQYSRLLFSGQLIPKDPPRVVPRPTRSNRQSKPALNLDSEEVPALQVNEDVLGQTWASAQFMLKESWLVWLSNVAVTLLSQSSSPALRACWRLASKNHNLCRELFNAAFVSCWTEVSDSHKQAVMNMLQEIAEAPDVPADVLKIILRLAELMERDGQKPFIAPELLAKYAHRCYALAKELHYREVEWEKNKSYEAIEQLIELNQNLDMHDSAIGMLNYVRKEQPEIYASDEWRLRLQQWDETLGIYDSPKSNEALSLVSIGDNASNIQRLFDTASWEALIPIYQRIWEGGERSLPEITAEVGMCLSWAMGDFERTEVFMAMLPDDNKDKHLCSALTSVHKRNYREATGYICKAREALKASLVSHIVEPYSRGYRQVFRCQMLTELEEIIAYNTTAHDERKQVIVKTWKHRLHSLKRDVGVWQKLLRLRSMALRPVHDMESWIKLINLSRNSGQMTIARNAIFLLLQDEASYFDEVSNGKIEGASSKLISQAKDYTCQRIIAIESAEQAEKGPLPFFSPIEPSSESTRAAWETRLHKIDSNGNPDLLGNLPLDCAIRLTNQPALVYMYLKYKWSVGECREAFQMMEMFAQSYSSRIKFNLHKPEDYILNHGAVRSSDFSDTARTISYYLSRLYCKQAEWLIRIEHDATLLAQKAGDVAKYKPAEANGANQASFKSWPPRRRGSNPASSRIGIVLAKTTTPATITSPTLSATGLALNEQVDSDIEFLFKLKGKQVGESVLESYRAATVLDRKWYKAWHSLALRHYYETEEYDDEQTALADDVIEKHVIPAVHGFFRAIQLFKEDTTLQDTLRLLTVWFKYSQHERVVQAVIDGFKTVPLRTWLQVIPQILARIDIKYEGTSRLIKQLLVMVGKTYPHAILFSLYVAGRSDIPGRSKAAREVLAELYEIHPALVDETEMVSHELIRLSMLLCERWLESLQEVREGFIKRVNLVETIKALKPLHNMMRNPETQFEHAFVNMFGKDLAAAEVLLDKYLDAPAGRRSLSAMLTAWEKYYWPVHEKCRRWYFYGEKVALRAKRLLLTDHTPKLAQLAGMSVVVPGTYDPAGDVVRIESFERIAKLHTTKKRPRDIWINGSDGKRYQFILKGNEDMRQDERAMQLFGLVKLLLSRDNEASRRSLSIEQFPVIPLSSNSGLAGYYPNCKDIHDIIYSYRVVNGIVPYYENDLAKAYAKEWQHLPVSHRLELFRIVQGEFVGNDLQRALWYKSPSAETWLTRRTNYTRSTAVMSMAGYILGLGDRHISNIMMHERTGKVVHIDFGDCFELAMHREHHPEKVPFRLTRMITMAMELGTIEGTFKASANHTMRVLRTNQESLMAVLEAFVFDPLVSWYFKQESQRPSEAGPGHSRASSNVATATTTPLGSPPKHFTKRVQPSLTGTSSKTIMSGSRPDQSGRAIMRFKQDIADEGDVYVGNPKARKIINRIRDKLTGEDFNPDEQLGVAEQVDKLIEQATSDDNLAVMWPGWMPFW
ncbi:phosphatidylinositol kinase- protein kinase tor1 [Coemansia thaxteri]|uniref:Serine/threonine-protein kinase TOR n=1 Tax=Coemansia thaxteri TaxID=2663907 RepID=A0A9W8BF98_9FUNG|nr:phosphatidylinositol kinase- protein kinase tor1 [Coemansia thaxteri]